MVLEALLLISSFLLLVVLALLLASSRKPAIKKRSKIKEDIKKIKQQIMN